MSIDASMDLDDDGVSDLIVGAPFNSLSQVRSGRVYFFHGNSNSE